MTRSLSIDDVEALFLRHGGQGYATQDGETISLQAHALQCAQLAEWADAGEAMVAAAFLHDLAPFLASAADAFGSDVAEPMRLHGAACRYLAAMDRDYLQGLSPAARQTLQQQGGPMGAAEADAFESAPHAMDAVQLCRWDEAAQVPGQRTPPLDYYLALLEDLQRSHADRDKVEVGPQTVS